MISTALVQGVAVHAAAAALLIVFSGTLTATFLSPAYSSTLLIVCSLTLITETLLAVETAQMRVEGRAVAFFVVGVLRLVLNIGFNLLLLVAMDLGPLGVLISGLASTTLISVWLLPRCLRTSGIVYSPEIGKALVVFGLPISIANVASFYIGSADRFLVGQFVSLAAVGVYGLAARLAQSVVSLTYDPFETVWDTEKYRLWSIDTNIRPFQRAFKAVFFVLLCATLGVALFSAEAVKLLAPPSFSDAVAIAPILTAAAVCNCLTRFCRFGTLIGNRTVNITFSAVLAGILLTGLCVILVPEWLARGAASAVLLTALARLLLEERLARRIVDLRLPWGPAMVAAAAALVVWAASSRIVDVSLVGFLVKAVLLVGFAAGVWFSPFFEADDRHAGLSMLRMRFRQAEG